MKNKIIFRAIVGSQSYGTSIPTSDIDIKGVYIQDEAEILGFGYKEQLNVTKDETYYEIRRFLELLETANPTVLELLFSPDECVLVKEPEFQILIDNRDKFLTKKCLHSFGGYAVAQIKKARGLNKKMNWEKEKITRKTPLDFIYGYDNGKTFPIKDWLDRNNYVQENCGLIGLNHFRDCYALYYDESGAIGFRGLAVEESNDIRLSSIPKEIDSKMIIFYNKDGYSMHCKDYKQYQEWLDNRNTQRYVDIDGHNQQIDGKNLLHCRRLLDTAIEIAKEGVLRVKRPNADYLLKIRKGEVDLDTIINEAEKDIKILDEAYKVCTLPQQSDRELVNSLLLKVRFFNK
jgi:predicted nucleotidyltransferase